MSAGFVKPDGLPTFNSGHALADDVLFCGVDLGDGTIVDVAGARTMHPFNVPSVGSSAYGKGIQWPGSNSNIGYVADVTTDSVIRDATHLADKGTGVGFTFACTFFQLATCLNSLIFGRPAQANESQPYANWCFFMENDGATANRVSCNLNNDGAGVEIGSFNVGGLSTFGTVVCSVVNTSAGVATAKLYGQGNLIATVPSLVIKDSAIIGGQDPENEIMFGTVYHVQTGFNFNTFNGFSFLGLFAGRAWDATEAAAWSENPYAFLDWGPVPRGRFRLV